MQLCPDVTSSRIFRAFGFSNCVSSHWQSNGLYRWVVLAVTQLSTVYWLTLYEQTCNASRDIHQLFKRNSFVYVSTTVRTCKRRLTYGSLVESNCKYYALAGAYCIGGRRIKDNRTIAFGYNDKLLSESYLCQGIRHTKR
jgi:hypothetical protein